MPLMSTTTAMPPSATHAPSKEDRKGNENTCLFSCSAHSMLGWPPEMRFYYFQGWLHRIKLITCGGIHFTIIPFLNLDGRDSHFALSPTSPLDSCRTSGALPPPPSSAPYSFGWGHLAEDVPVCGCGTVHSSHSPGSHTSQSPTL